MDGWIMHFIIEEKKNRVESKKGWKRRISKNTQNVVYIYILVIWVTALYFKSNLQSISQNYWGWRQNKIGECTFLRPMIFRKSSWCNFTFNMRFVESSEYLTGVNRFRKNHRVIVVELKRKTFFINCKWTTFMHEMLHFNAKNDTIFWSIVIIMSWYIVNIHYIR